MAAPKRGGLGRGLGALIPSGSQPAEDQVVDLRVDHDLGTAGRLAELPVDLIDPNPRQPRTVFDEEALGELTASIREVGLLQPVVVRPSGAGRYELVMGERRLRASREAGLASVPAVVRETGDDVMLRDALLENLHRSGLNPLEEAAAYQQLLEDFGVTHEELGKRIGRSRPQVSNTLRLLNLPPAVQRRVAAGVLSAGHARALLALEDAEAQDAMAGRIVAEGWSVRATEEAVHLAAAATTPRKPAVRRAAEVPERAAEVAEALGEWLDTRVRVEATRRRGRIVIEFGSGEDLERIAELLRPSDRDIGAGGPGYRLRDLSD